jgi:hypothetical protein
MRRRYASILTAAIALTIAVISSPVELRADCESNGDSPSTHEAFTCVIAGYGSNNSRAFSFTLSESGTYPDSGSTEVWIDGGSGPSSGTYFAEKEEEPMCGDVRGLSNNWLIFGYNWVSVATWWAVEDFNHPCE